MRGPSSLWPQVRLLRQELTGEVQAETSAPVAPTPSETEAKIPVAPMPASQAAGEDAPCIRTASKDSKVFTSRRVAYWT